MLVCFCWALKRGPGHSLIVVEYTYEGNECYIRVTIDKLLNTFVTDLMELSGKLWDDQDDRKAQDGEE